MPQLALPGFDDSMSVYTCPLCGQVKTLFGQYSPLFPWGVCRECSIKYPYPVELFVPSTRRNRDREPLMIDPAPERSALRERRIQLDEMLRCAVDPSRLERPIIKYNLSGLELRNPIRRSKAHQYQRMHFLANHNLNYQQIALPICARCGRAHNRQVELRPGMVDYRSHCQRCEDEMAVEALFRGRAAIFGADDEDGLDRMFAAFPELFERGVLPDYWFTLVARKV